MNKDKEPQNNWPSYEETLARIVDCKKPSSLAIAVNNPRITKEQERKIHGLIGVLSRHPLQTAEPCQEAETFINDNQS